jgi:hypothetical protein
MNPQREGRKEKKENAKNVLGEMKPSCDCCLPFWEDGLVVTRTNPAQNPSVSLY